jgi:hypothetical protein
MSEVNILDELLDTGIPEEDATLLSDIISRSSEVTVSNREEKNSRIVLVRGVLDEKLNLKGKRVGNSIVKCGRNYVVVFWREGVLRWRYLLIAGCGVSNACGG